MLEGSEGVLSLEFASPAWHRNRQALTAEGSRETLPRRRGVKGHCARPVVMFLTVELGRLTKTGRVFGVGLSAVSTATLRAATMTPAPGSIAEISRGMKPNFQTCPRCNPNHWAELHGLHRRSVASPPRRRRRSAGLRGHDERDRLGCGTRSLHPSRFIMIIRG